MCARVRILCSWLESVQFCHHSVLPQASQVHRILPLEGGCKSEEVAQKDQGRKKEEKRQLTILKNLIPLKGKL